MTKIGNFYLCKIYDKDELFVILAFNQNPLGKLLVVTMRSSDFWNLTGNPLNFVLITVFSCI